MGAISQFSAFDDGVAAGRRLITLFEELGLDFAALDPPSKEHLEKILHFMWDRSRIKRPYPAVAGFISTVIRANHYDASIINVFGAHDFIKAQSEAAPIANIPEAGGFIQFAEWTGESDGDAWCFDLMTDHLRCVPVSSGSDDLNKVRSDSYGVFSNCHHLAAYLRCEAEMRGWFDDDDASSQKKPEAN